MPIEAAAPAKGEAARKPGTAHRAHDGRRVRELLTRTGSEEGLLVGAGGEPDQRAALGQGLVEDERPVDSVPPRARDRQPKALGEEPGRDVPERQHVALAIDMQAESVGEAHGRGNESLQVSTVKRELLASGVIGPEGEHPDEGAGVLSTGQKPVPGKVLEAVHRRVVD